MCSLVEEISFIIGFPIYFLAILAYILRDFSSEFSRLLGLSVEDVVTILFGNEVDFMALISYFSKNNQALDLLGTFYLSVVQ